MDMMMENEEEKYQFMVVNDFATGEGATLSLMVTRAYPDHEDYDWDNSSIHSVLLPPLKEGITPQSIATREFKEVFGAWTTSMMQFLSRKEFLDQCGSYLPPHVKTFLVNKEIDDAGNFKYYSQYHVNFS